MPAAVQGLLKQSINYTLDEMGGMRAVSLLDKKQAWSPLTSAKDHVISNIYGAFRSRSKNQLSDSHFVVVFLKSREITNTSTGALASTCQTSLLVNPFASNAKNA
jgi:hypothetical protein